MNITLIIGVVKKYNHSMFLFKPTNIVLASLSELVSKTDFKRMGYPVYIIITALSIFYLGKNSFRNIALILRVAHSFKVSYTTIRSWFKKFAPFFNNFSLGFIPMLDFNSDEGHADETGVTISGKKYYIWHIVDSETPLF